MTTLVTGGRPIVAHPRGGQWDEAQDATHRAEQARLRGDSDAHQFWSGVSCGYMAAYSPWLLWRDDLKLARRNLFARTETYESIVDRLDRFGIVNPQRKDTLKAAGVLFGYSQATAEEPDAEECAAPCAGRILTMRDDDAVETWHGWFCNDDCHLSYDRGACCRPERDDPRDR
jgi:hypothetical protein